MNINLDINQIVNQIAEGLGLATDKVAELYPQLIREYSIYRFSEATSGILLIVSMIYCTMVLIYAINCDTECKKFNLKCFIPGVVLVVIFIVIFLLEALMAPNVLLLVDLFMN